MFSLTNRFVHLFLVYQAGRDPVKEEQTLMWAQNTYLNVESGIHSGTTTQASSVIAGKEMDTDQLMFDLDHEFNQEGNLQNVSLLLFSPVVFIKAFGEKQWNFNLAENPMKNWEYFYENSN